MTKDMPINREREYITSIGVHKEKDFDDKILKDLAENVRRFMSKRLNVKMQAIRTSIYGYSIKPVSVYDMGNISVSYLVSFSIYEIGGQTAGFALTPDVHGLIKEAQKRFLIGGLAERWIPYLKN